MHDTPVEVANVLARHAPRQIRSVLDPAVGRGALISAISGRINGSVERIVCIDIDQASVEHVQQIFKPIFGRAFKALEADFLKLTDSFLHKKLPTFDCVVMNPPFCGRLNEWVEIDFFREGISTGNDIRKVPLEAAFVIRAIGVLRPGGCLLAIIPSSLISSEKMSWFRQRILQVGSVQYVHELPRHAFKRFAGRAYILVYKKATKQRDLLVLNHDLTRPNRLSVKKRTLFEKARFDYGFHSSSLLYEKIRSTLNKLNWVKIKDIAEIYRGGIESPLGAKRAIHTCNQGGGIWKRCDDSSPLLADSSLKGIREGDLLIKRVGRNCARSSGMAIDLEGLACSDCVLIMRPKNGISSTEMLFALRFLLCSCGLTQLIERGTGASYITENGLRNLMIPIGLCRDHPLKYMKYCYAVNQDSALMMRSIEDQLSKIYNSCLFNTG